jgi:hypothetical protein
MKIGFHIQKLPKFTKKHVLGSKLDKKNSLYALGHDYYSIWFNFSAAFFISEKKAVVIKLKTHYFISYHLMKC